MVKLLSMLERKKTIDLIQQYFLVSHDLNLKKISNTISSEAIMSNNRDLMYFSYFPYMLYKIMTQPHIIHSPRWDKNKKTILAYFDTLEKRNLDEYPKEINYFISLFRIENKDLYYYFKNILEKSKVKKASDCYEHGITINKAVELTGAERVEVVRYLGNSKINYDIGKDVIDSKVKIIEEFFM